MTITAISADSHVTEPGDCYLPYIDPAFHDRAPVAGDARRHGRGHVGGQREERHPLRHGRRRRPVVGTRSAPSSTSAGTSCTPGGWDATARLAEQDRDGVGAEVLYPSVGMLLCNHPDADYKHACFDAYNRWLTDFASTAPDRLLGIGQTALRPSRRASPTSRPSRPPACGA